MTQLIVEGELLTKLRGLKEKVELLDDKGRLVGIFDPTSDAGKVQIIPPFSDEEIRRRLQNPNRKPLSEILKGLPES